MIKTSITFNKRQQDIIVKKREKTAKSIKYTTAKELKTAKR